MYESWEKTIGLYVLCSAYKCIVLSVMCSTSRCIKNLCNVLFTNISTRHLIFFRYNHLKNCECFFFNVPYFRVDPCWILLYLPLSLVTLVDHYLLAAQTHWPNLEYNGMKLIVVSLLIRFKENRQIVCPYSERDRHLW